MVAARMPAITTPANSGGSRSCDNTINTFSALLLLRSEGSVGASDRPNTPITTAANSEITTQTVAIRLDFFSWLDLRMAINRSNTWGTPK